MKLGITVRIWGPQSTRETIEACARLADDAGLDSLWVNEHLAVPPEGAEGMDGGRFLEPLASIAFLAGITRRIVLGTGVLILPYRPPLLTAKLVATIQELSGGRLNLGVGVGWLEAEFRVLGVDRRRRGALTDEALDLLHACFKDDLVEVNGQKIIFRPRPTRPPIYVGGAPPHAFKRAIRYGEGWIPAGIGPDDLKGPIAALQKLAAQSGRGPLEVVAMKTLPIEDPSRAADYARAFADVGVTHLVHAASYANPAEYERSVEALLNQVRPALA